VFKNFAALALSVKSKWSEGVKKYEITRRAKTSTNASASRFGKKFET
jgi:hypothetical protein